MGGPPPPGSTSLPPGARGPSPSTRLPGPPPPPTSYHRSLYGGGLEREELQKGLDYQRYYKCIILL